MRLARRAPRLVLEMLRRAIWVRLCCVLLIAISGLAAAAQAEEAFNLLAPAKLTGLQKRAVRLSEYSVVLATPGGAVPLLDPGDRSLGIALSHDDFCAASL